MRTLEINIYQFNELSEAAKERARQWYLNLEDFSFVYHEAHKTVKEFNDLFDTREGSRSWLDISTNYIEDNILNLSGQRLRTYILNNYSHKLFKKKYLGSSNLSEVKPKYHKMRTIREVKQGANKGLFSSYYYSNIQTSNSCVLTGVCYDDDILQPIYDFIEKPNETTFEDLLNECIESLRISIENEIEYLQSDESVDETIEINGYEFDEEGNRI
jgi:hypothetical protein